MTKIKTPGGVPGACVDGVLLRRAGRLPPVLHGGWVMVVMAKADKYGIHWQQVYHRLAVSGKFLAAFASGDEGVIFAQANILLHKDGRAGARRHWVIFAMILVQNRFPSYVQGEFLSRRFVTGQKDRGLW